ncbi:peptidase S8/S53 domain-containing protein [Podospora didyma]|uniref:Peptidase S8/S53 domain-containing protein n=1 Tax=Podospora didyma TaxID=330526 RepID=A0AAE0KA42_9PEZI|nr:peptidase S8/S53 domain-containing protein [Podospora didyma]
MVQICRVLSVLGTFLALVSARTLNNSTELLPETTVIPNAYTVEFADGFNTESFYAALNAQDIKFTQRRTMEFKLFMGCSFELGAGGDPAVISSMPMIKNLWPITSHKTMDIEEVHSGGDNSTNKTTFKSRMMKRTKRQAAAAPAGNDTMTTHIMTQVDKLHAEGFTGKGVRVAVLDTGIDYRHPALGGCFGPGCLVTHGYDFVDDDADPSDCNGHGSHVAGIIAAQTNPLGFVGAAPGVTLGAYRVAQCSGFIVTDWLLAGVNQAYDDGFDIINFSLVFRDFGWSQDPVSVAIQRIVDAGVPCIAAQGNDGNFGVFLSGSPAVGNGVAGISSFVNPVTPQIQTGGSSYKIDDGEPKPFLFRQRLGSFTFPKISLPLLALTSDTTSTQDGCDNLPPDGTDLSGYVILVRSSADEPQCQMSNKIVNLLRYGARYIIFYSRSASVPQPEDGFGIQGSAMVSAALGAEWVSLLSGGHEVIVNIDGSGPLAVYSLNNTETGGFVSRTSSWGLSWELNVKPSFGAPGQDILSTYRLSRGDGYMVLSGTSMASPLVAAVYALLFEARPDLRRNPAVLHNLLASTAKPNLWHDGVRAHDILAPVPQQGAGLIQAYDAAHTTTFLSVSSLALNDSNHFVSTTTFEIQNKGTQEVTYQLSHVKAATVYSSSTSFLSDPIAWEISPTAQLELASAYAALSFSSNTITIPAGGSTTITVTPTLPSGLDPGRWPIYSGFIAINGTNGDSLSLPYAGVAGPMVRAPALYSTPDRKWMQRWDTGDILPENATLTIPRPLGPPNQGAVPGPDDPAPVAALNLKTGTAFIRLDIIPLEVDGPLETSEVLGVTIAGSLEGFPDAFYGRIGFLTPFRGMLSDGRVVPEGRYQIIARALKVFGDREKKEDYSVELLPAFNLRYSD